MAATLKSKMAAEKKHISAWQTTDQDSGDPKEYFDTTCQLLPKSFAEP